jgi:adenylate cyclase
MADIDFEKEGLLEGLDDDGKESRRKLLEELVDDGFELDDLREAVDQDRLALLPVETVLGGEPRYTAEEVAEKAKVDLDFLRRLWNALGMPVANEDEKAYTKADVDAAKGVHKLLETGLPEDGMLDITRSMSQSMATLAASVGNVFGDAFLREGDNELDLARRYTDVAKEVAPQVPLLMAHVFALQQREELRRAMVDLETVSKGELAGSEDITVAFADLVGFTRLGERIPPEELGAVASRLGELAMEAAQAPVRFVKTIGDAAMLVSYKADPVIKATLALVDAADKEGEDFPQLRAGMAAGSGLRRAGDWYGRPVNLASRITGKARPGAVLASEDVKERAGEDFNWSFAHNRKIKGLKEEVPLYRVRLPGDSGGGDSDDGGGD